MTNANTATQTNANDSSTDLNDSGETPTVTTSTPVQSRAKQILELLEANRAEFQEAESQLNAIKSARSEMVKELFHLDMWKKASGKGKAPSKKIRFNGDLMIVCKSPKGEGYYLRGENQKEEDILDLG